MKNGDAETTATTSAATPGKRNDRAGTRGPMIGLAIIPDVLKEPKAVTVALSGVAGEAARAMVAAGSEGCAVVDDAGALAGVLGWRRLLALIAAGEDPWQTPVARVMTAGPDRLLPGDCPLDAMALMEIRGVECLPVVDAGRVVGIVGLSDLQRLARAEIERGFARLQQDVFGQC